MTAGCRHRRTGRAADTPAVHRRGAGSFQPCRPFRRCPPLRCRQTVYLCTGAVYSACCRSGTDPAPPSGADRKAAVPRRCTARYAAYRLTANSAACRSSGAQQQLADCVAVQLRKKCVFHHYPPKTPCNFTFVLWESCCHSRSCFPASGICCAVFGILISVFADVKNSTARAVLFSSRKSGDYTNRIPIFCTMCLLYHCRYCHCKENYTKIPGRMTRKSQILHLAANCAFSV